MTTEPFRTPPVERAPAAGARPSPVVAGVVVVLAHAVLMAGGAAATAAGLVAFGLTHNGFRWSPALLVPLALNLVLVLALAVAEVVLVRRFARGGSRARVALTVCLAVSALLALQALVFSAVRGLALSVPVVTLQVVEILLCAAGVVLLWRAATGAWLRARSVGPARPGL